MPTSGSPSISNLHCSVSLPLSRILLDQQQLGLILDGSGDRRRGGGRRGGLGALRGDGPHGSVRAVRGAARGRRREDGVPWVRRGGGDRGGVEPDRPAEDPGGGRGGRGGEDLQGGAAPAVAAAPQRDTPLRGVDGRPPGEAQLHHGGVHVRQPQGVPGEAPERVGQGHQEVGQAGPRGARLPPHPRPLHRPQGPQLQQRLHQWQHRPGEAGGLRVSCSGGEGRRGALGDGDAGVHAGGAVRGQLHGARGHIRVRHVRAGDVHQRDPIQGVRLPREDLQEGPRRRRTGLPPEGRRSRGQGLHPQVPRPPRQAPPAPLRHGPPPRPLLPRPGRRSRPPLITGINSLGYRNYV